MWHYCHQDADGSMPRAAAVSAGELLLQNIPGAAACREANAAIAHRCLENCCRDNGTGQISRSDFEAYIRSLLTEKNSCSTGCAASPVGAAAKLLQSRQSPPRACAGPQRHVTPLRSTCQGTMPSVLHPNSRVASSITSSTASLPGTASPFGVQSVSRTSIGSTASTASWTPSAVSVPLTGNSLCSATSSSLPGSSSLQCTTWSPEASLSWTGSSSVQCTARSAEVVHAAETAPKNVQRTTGIWTEASLRRLPEGSRGVLCLQLPQSACTGQEGSPRHSSMSPPCYPGRRTPSCTARGTKDCQSANSTPMRCKGVAVAPAMSASPPVAPTDAGTTGTLTHQTRVAPPAGFQPSPPPIASQRGASCLGTGLGTSRSSDIATSTQVVPRLHGTLPERCLAPLFTARGEEALPNTAGGVTQRNSGATLHTASSSADDQALANLEAVYAEALERCQAERREAESALLKAQQRLVSVQEVQKAERQEWADERRVLLRAVERHFVPDLDPVLLVPAGRVGDAEAASSANAVRQQEMLEEQLRQERQARDKERATLQRLLAGQVKLQRMEETLSRLRSVEEPDDVAMTFASLGSNSSSSSDPAKDCTTTSPSRTDEGTSSSRSAQSASGSSRSPCRPRTRSGWGGA